MKAPDIARPRGVLLPGDGIHALLVAEATALIYCSDEQLVDLALAVMEAGAAACKAGTQAKTRAEAAAREVKRRAPFRMVKGGKA